MRVFGAIVISAAFSLFATGEAEAASAPRAEEWSSPLFGLTRFTIDKKLRDPTTEELGPGAAFAPLPPNVALRLGDAAIDYESFVVTHLPPGGAAALKATLASEGFSFSVRERVEIRLPWHVAEPSQRHRRSDPMVAAILPPRAVPGLWLVQFAYPIKDEWRQSLSRCGFEEIAYFQDATFLVRTRDTQAPVFHNCAAAPYLRWAGPYLTTDRIARDLVGFGSEESYWLQFVYGTDLFLKAAILPPGVVAEEVLDSPADATAELRVRADRAQLLALVADDPDLLSVTRHGEGTPSDEKQGQIVAGNHNGTSVTAPGYRSWLNGRGLLTTSNQQVVAVMDLGYDDGTGPLGSHHPDLENPERLDGIAVYHDGGGLTPTADDQAGHGTMVSGIIVGEGVIGFGSGAKDSLGYHYGSGVAPGAKVYFARLETIRDTTQQQQAIDDAYARGAVIANHSWNMRDTGRNPYRPVNGYEARARFFDNRVRDAKPPEEDGLQPMTFVFSAGNYAAFDPNNEYGATCRTFLWDSVASPATAKNVIAIGATENDRPAPNPPLACRPCDSVNSDANLDRPPNNNATHIASVADFSSRGKEFNPYPSAAVSWNTRIKPDLVAPGVRVFSTVPYQHPGYDTLSSVTGCSKYFPTSPLSYHTYGSGTSFAAPVVTGVAALLRKRMLDPPININPTPSLIKAALIATADDLGGLGENGGDHRPSPDYGWGRVNLNRLTDAAQRFMINETTPLFTGQSLSLTKTIDNGALPTYIVLVWTDLPTLVNGDSQAALINDLDLRVNGGAWRGNAFNEALIGTDDGYSYRFPVCTCPDDRINTVEAVFLPPGTFASGASISIRVVAANVPQGSQTFSLYAYNVRP
ncbi:MAG TPA: S8 family serine peptidase [Thermoanaerobaculia bacterium]|nr:S8 family serine peptidase [Thermoanaerobaculia bacterium]